MNNNLNQFAAVSMNVQHFVPLRSNDGTKPRNKYTDHDEYGEAVYYELSPISRVLYYAFMPEIQET
jgi:hypothetical protein